MPVRRYLFFCIVALSLFTAGCIDMRQEVWVNEDGSGWLVMNIGIDVKLMALIETMRKSDKDSGKDPISAFIKDAELLREDPNVVAVGVEEKTEADLHHLILDVEFKDFAEMDETMRRLEEKKKESGDDEESDAPEFGFTIDETSPGRYSFAFRMGDKEREEDDGEDDPAGAADVMMKSQFAGKHFRLILHAPEVLEADGAMIDKEGKRAEWTQPMLAVVERDEPLVLRATFARPTPSARPWEMKRYVLAAVVLLVAFLAVSRFTRR